MRKNSFIAFMLIVVMLLVGCQQVTPIQEGMESLEKGDYKAAETSFQAAIDQNVLPGEAYRGIGICKWEQQDYAGVKDALEKALSNGADKTGTLYNMLGSSCMQLEKYTYAINYFNLGLSFDDCSEEVKKEMQYNMIVCYEKTGQWENAASKAKAYLASYPDDERVAKEVEFFETQE